ncbi:MAG TPA: hypothetical protein VGX92_06895 [Pyrinomonadaceae bacterium]|nr:hypothetical protein [Pyrinomonadaceae bacterium]
MAEQVSDVVFVNIRRSAFCCRAPRDRHLKGEDLRACVRPCSVKKSVEQGEYIPKLIAATQPELLTNG